MAHRTSIELVHIPGLSAGTLAKNRRFWDDTYVEPKQQHRFGINFPVYMNMGPEDTSELAKLYADAENNDGVHQPTGRSLKVGPNNKYRNIGTRADGKGKGGLYLRTSEYIGFSFTPPAVTFTQGYTGASPGGSPQPDDSNNKYGIGDATLTLVTTLRDDLNFSLNFLFAISTHADSSRGAARLFPPAVCEEKTPKILAIKEYSARQDTIGSSDAIQEAIMDEAKTPADAFAKQGARVVGIHKIKDPIIKSATFSEFTYGGTELVKVTLVLSYGRVDTVEGKAGGHNPMRDFYSYETATRYGRSYHTWDDDTGAGKDKVPEFNRRKREAFTDYPNWMSTDRVKATMKRIKVRPGYPQPSKPEWGSERTGPVAEGGVADIQTNKKRIDYIRGKIEESNSSHPRPPPVRQSINELVTRSIMNAVSGKDAFDAEAARRQHERDLTRRVALEGQAEIDRAEAQWASEQTDARVARWEASQAHVEGIERRAHLMVDMKNSAADFRARRELYGGNSQDVLRREIDRRNTPSRAELQQRLDALKDK
tara:strand:- start:59 stop:1675 length:1617 start_codon:yes stop_codon:yes gene_type:complete